MIIGGRFIPGGQTAVSLSAGILGYRWPRYALLAGVGASLWACYGTLLGFLGGQTFERDLWKGTLLSLAIAVTIAVLIELARRLRQNNTSRRRTHNS